MTIKAYKGFDPDMKCRGHQFEVGQTYEHDGPVKACRSGFHACTNPFDVWGHYPIVNSDGALNRFAEVTLSGDTSTNAEDSKIAAGRITIEAELKLPDFIKRAVSWVIDQATGKDEGGDNARIGSSGDSARIGSSGDSAQIGSSGDYARIGSSGDYARIGSSGYNAQIGSSGYNARIGSSGDNARIGSSGYNARIVAEGKDALVSCAAPSVVTLGEMGAMAIPYHDGERWRYAIGYVGEDGIKPNVAYTARDGKLVEAS